MAGQASGKKNATGETNLGNIFAISLATEDRINLDPNSQPDIGENDWQTIPILRQRQNRHKRMRLSPTPSPEQVTTQNRFSQLNVDENEKNNVLQGEKPNKIPPIVLYGIKDVTKLKELIDSVLEKSQYSFKVVTKNQLRVTTKDTDTYKKLMALVRERKLIGHTFTPKSDRPYRIVIKNLHHSTPIDAIKEAIESTGNIVRDEIITARHGPTKTPLSTWFVNLVPGPANDAVKKLKYIYNTSVLIEDPKRKKTIPQCKRCQQYGHTRNYCLRPYRCVKCAENHNTADCPKKDRKEPAKCALCLGDHAANYKGCKVFQEIQKRKLVTRIPSNRVTNLNKENLEMPENPTNINDKPTFAQPDITYAQVTAGTNLETIIAKQAEKLDRLIDQMGTLMSLLTTLVNKLVV